jgi:cold shock CspA family protein
MKITGTVRSYDRSRKFGFVAIENLGDCFIHGVAATQPVATPDGVILEERPYKITPNEGELVTVDVAHGPKGLTAKHWYREAAWIAASGQVEYVKLKSTRLRVIERTGSEPPHPRFHTFDPYKYRVIWEGTAAQRSRAPEIVPNRYFERLEGDRWVKEQ